MATPPDHVQHPDLGEIVWLAEDNRWFGEYRDPNGRTIDVFVEPGTSDPVAYLARVSELFRRAIAARQDLLAEAASESLVRFFRDIWGEDERGQLTAEELVARLRWESIWIEGEDPLWVVYVYQPLTAGLFDVYNSIQLYADADLRYRDTHYYRSGPPNPGA